MLIQKCWNKYRSDLTRQPKSKNLDYMIDPTFRNIILFNFRFKAVENDTTGNLFDKCYMLLVESKVLMN